MGIKESRPVTAAEFHHNPEAMRQEYPDFRIFNLEAEGQTMKCRKCGGISHAVSIGMNAITLTCEQVSCRAKSVIIANVLA